MNSAPDQLGADPGDLMAAVRPAPSNTPAALLRLARPHQWVKGAFVLIGPLYGFVFMREALWATVACVLAAFMAFAFASSACYIINDLKDIDADRAHPRKRRRPLASGAVTPRAALILALALSVLAALAVVSICFTGLAGAHNAALWVGATVLLYSANVIAYSIYLKHKIIADVISLALGFVLRVLGGCASVWVQPSSWLLNVTLFAAMFLALGKRLGERRTMGEAVAQVRGVQALYTDTLLQMLVVVTGVATLMTYAGYVQAMADKYHAGFNLLWLTILPATYGLLRCIVMLEKGIYDDPTELARKDRAFQLSGLVFVLLTVCLMVYFRR